MNTPRIGDTVHYTSHGTPVREDGTRAYEPRCRAAIVTELNDRNTLDPRLMSGPHPELIVGLMINNPTGQFFHPLDIGGIHYDHIGAHTDDDGDTTPTYRGFTPGTWHHTH